MTPLKTSTFAIACIAVPMVPASCSTPVTILEDRDLESVRRPGPRVVDDARIRGCILFVDTVCGDFDGKSSDFRLYMTPANFQGSNPRRANLLLTYDNGQLLEHLGYNPMTIRFDLSPVLDRYKTQYGKIDEIMLKFSGSKTVVNYSP